MKNPVVIVGIGQMGSTFAHAFLRLGHPVFPVTRGMDMAEAAALVEPELVIIAVAEKDLDHVLQTIPRPWRSKLLLLQNELLPEDWSRYNLEPTVISVWFEKKKGRNRKVIIPSPVYGRHAQHVADALETIDIPARVLASADDLLFELVLKNVYILTTNISGLQTGGTVAELWSQHQDVAISVANEIIQLQQKLASKSFDSDRLVEAMVLAFDGDPEHECTGRRAADRLERALELADERGLDLPQLKHIASIQ